MFEGEILGQIKKFYLLLDGDSLEIIMKDQFLFQHLAYVLAVSTKVVGFNMKPHHKQLVIEMLK